MVGENKKKFNSKDCKITLYGKTAIVTGANSGLGYITALDLATRGARVILACRNPKLAEVARDNIISETKNTNVEVKLIDFASLDSVRAFAKNINETEDRLDILVNNAGAVLLGDHKTEDGLHVLMQVNYFGPFLLTVLLLDLLKRSAPSRIVNLSSGLAKLANLIIDKINEPSSRSPLTNFLGADYCNSKLCNILMSNELAERLKGTGVVSNSLHPGVVKTEVQRNMSWFKKALIEPMLMTPEEGAQTQIYCAVSDEMEKVTGKYLTNVQIAEMPSKATNELARKTVGEK